MYKMLTHEVLYGRFSRSPKFRYMHWLFTIAVPGDSASVNSSPDLSLIILEADDRSRFALGASGIRGAVHIYKKRFKATSVLRQILLLSRNITIVCTSIFDHDGPST